MTEETINAEVISVYPNKVKIAVDDEFIQSAAETLKVGSYIRVSDDDDVALIAMIENFMIEVSESGAATRRYIIEANPLGVVKDGKFERGGDTIAIPPKKVEPAREDEIASIYLQSSEEAEKFEFSSLSSNPNIRIPVNGNKFFNKHIAVVGSTGSGKSHTVTKIIQQAVNGKDSDDYDLNNSHIIIFDIHSEYKAAFPDANILGIGDLTLPYWLLTSEELEELFIDTEANDHNQRNVFKEAVITERIKEFTGDDVEKSKIHFDSPLVFDIEKVLDFAISKNREIIDTGEVYASGAKKGQAKTVNGSLFGKLTNFVSRLENKLNDKRLDFLLGDDSKSITFEDTIKQLIGQGERRSNVTILDLSGVPFEVLSITVSLISRILFEYSYYYKRLRSKKDIHEKINNDTPFLLVYEEAHKYVPKSDLVKFRASKNSIERIAKEGRKYGITLLLSSQRPSEISETIFSQCNNFIAMRLTNPVDQNYVKRLLPDTLGNVTAKLPSLQAGEALLTGEAVVLPSIVKIDKCDLPPSSSDIPYWELWKQEWKEADINEIKTEWYL